MLYLPHQPEKAKEFFQKALAYMPSGTPVSIAQSELTFPAFIWNKDRRTVPSITSTTPSAKIAEKGNCRLTPSEGLHFCLSSAS